MLGTILLPEVSNPNITIAMILALIMGIGLLFGICASKLHLPSTVGYLLAGAILSLFRTTFNIPPSAPAALASIGIILIMFDIGTRFNFSDLWEVKNIVTPGVIIVCSSIAIIGAVITKSFGPDVSWTAAFIVGASLSITSTITLTKILHENHILHTKTGVIGIGWTVLDDILSIALLVMIICFANLKGASKQIVAMQIGITLFQTAIIVVLILVLGVKLIPWFLDKIAKTHSREFFTIAIISIALTVAVGLNMIAGISIAFGAFLGGMVVGKAKAHFNELSDAMPLRDAFTVVFFTSVGMQIEPEILLAYPTLTILSVLLIFVVKAGLTAFMVWLLKSPIENAILVGLSLTSIGEFSYVLIQEAADKGLMPPEIRSIIVLVAVFTMSFSAIMFKSSGSILQFIKQTPWLWKILSRRKNEEKQTSSQSYIGHETAIVVGYGTIGQEISAVLKEYGFTPIIIELNPETVAGIRENGSHAVYGDACQARTLEAAELKKASYVIVTTTDFLGRLATIKAVRAMRPDVKIIARARYIREQEQLIEAGASQICTEEIDVAMSMTKAVLVTLGEDTADVEFRIEQFRDEFGDTEISTPSQS